MKSNQTGSNWKWWQFMLIGALIALYGGYQIYTQQFSKAVGSEVLGFLCVAFGIFSKTSQIEE